MFLNFVHPVVDRLVRFFVCGIVHDNDAMRSLVVGRSDGLESLLASGVPNLEFDCFAVNFKGSDFLELERITKSTPIVGMKLSVKVSS